MALSSPRGLRLLISLLALLSPVTPARGAPNPMPLGSLATGACTDKERWEFSWSIPRQWQDDYAKTFEDDKTAFARLLAARMLFDASRIPEGQAFALYWVGRALLKLNLVHPAAEVFKQIVSLSSRTETTGIRLAALSCLLGIRKKFLGFEHIIKAVAAQGGLAFPLKSLTREQRDLVWQLLLESNAGGSDPPSKSTGNYSLLDLGQIGLKGLLVMASTDYPDQKPYYDFARLIAAGVATDDAKVIDSGEALLRNTTLPEALNDRRDLIHLLLGQAYYAVGRYESAYRSFKAVRNTSNLFTQALTGQSWAALQRNDLGSAVGHAHSFLTGGLRRTFMPDAHVIIAIAFNETCHYREAIESIKYFRKRYQKTQSWLAGWNAVAATRPPNLYQGAVGYLQRKYRIPDPIGSEWLGSSVFLASQSEINIILTQRQAIAGYLQNLARFTKPTPAMMRNRAWVGAGASLHAFLSRFPKTLAEREQQLINRIRADLTNRTRAMSGTIDAMNAIADLLSAEVYNAFGEKVIADQVLVRQPNKPKAPSALAGSAQSQPPVWDWGAFNPEGDSEDSEVWEDELGFLKTDLASKCITK